MPSRRKQRVNTKSFGESYEFAEAFYLLCCPLPGRDEPIPGGVPRDRREGRDQPSVFRIFPSAPMVTMRRGISLPQTARA